nr:hypothetical protein [Actinomycetota bacterium]
TFTYAYLGEQAPRYVQALLAVFGVVIVGAVVAAVLRRKRQGKRVPLVDKKDAIEESEGDFDSQPTG